MRPAILTKEKVRAKLWEARGNLAAVARAFRVSRQAVCQWMRRNPDMREVLAEARETMIDVAESVLYQKVREGHFASLVFYLRTQARDRGYGNRPAAAVPDPLPPMSDEERVRQINELLDRVRRRTAEKEAEAPSPQSTE